MNIKSTIVLNKDTNKIYIPSKKLDNYLHTLYKNTDDDKKN